MKAVRAFGSVAQGETAEPLTIVHGFCPRGADQFTHLWCNATDRGGWEPLTIVEETHPAEWRKYGKCAGIIRNVEMVELGADFCLAFIRDGSRGASHTADLAEAAGIPTQRFIE